MRETMSWVSFLKVDLMNQSSISLTSILKP